MAAHPDTSTLIIGAGPSGLAVGACLSQQGAGALIVERAQAVGSAWRNHYERLHLHTTKRHSALPGLDFPADVPTYPSRLQVVDYLERYTTRHGLSPRFGETVTRVARDRDGFLVRTDKSAHRCWNVVVAAGYNRVPKEPCWPGQAGFRGDVRHSSEYRSGAGYRGQRVLVVGSGNSGAEIALDLWEHGARPSICIRGPVHIVPRDLAGIPAQTTALALRALSPEIVDALTEPLLRRVIGDLTPWGIRRPAKGPMQMIVEEGRVPLIDVGTLSLIKQGLLPVVPGIEAFHEREVEFVDGRRHAFEAVVLATGYRAELADFLDGVDGLVDERGYPRWRGSPTPIPGLFFVGYSNPHTGFLREIAIEARRVADLIVERGRSAH